MTAVLNFFFVSAFFLSFWSLMDQIVLFLILKPALLLVDRQEERTILTDREFLMRVNLIPIILIT